MKCDICLHRRQRVPRAYRTSLSRVIVPVKRVKHFFVTDRCRSELPNFDSGGIIGDNRCLQCRRTSGEHCGKIGSDGIAGADHVIDLAGSRWYAVDDAVGGHERHAALAKRQQQMLNPKALEGGRQRRGMFEVDGRAQSALGLSICC